MEIDRIELKRQAREAMRLPSPRFWLVALVYLLATTGVTLAVDFIPASGPNSGLGFTSMFLSILIALYTAVVRFGFRLWCLWTHRRLDPDLGALMQGFSVSGRVILMELDIFFRVLGWSVVLALAASGPLGLLVALASSSPILMVVIAVLWVIFIVVSATFIELRYSLAPYLLADHPDDGSSAAVRRSVDMTRGWKRELFKLEISFWGWGILNLALSCAVLAWFLAQHGVFQTMAVDPYQFLLSVEAVLVMPTASLLSTLATFPLSLWLEPYRNVTRAGFYDARLQIQQESAPSL